MQASATKLQAPPIAYGLAEPFAVIL